jgi:hypothetical protein
MITRTLNRIASALWVVALFAGLLVSSAAAGVRDGRSPDTKDAAYLAHLDGRSPDTIDAAAQAHAPTTPIFDLRSPDTKDAAAAAHATPAASIVGSNGGFHWTDAGIGAAGGFALALIVGGLFLLTNRGSRGKLAV